MVGSWVGEDVGLFDGELEGDADGVPGGSVGLLLGDDAVGFMLGDFEGGTLGVLLLGELDGDALILGGGVGFFEGNLLGESLLG